MEPKKKTGKKYIHWFQRSRCYTSLKFFQHSKKLITSFATHIYRAFPQTFNVTWNFCCCTKGLLLLEIFSTILYWETMIWMPGSLRYITKYECCIAGIFCGCVFWYEKSTEIKIAKDPGINRCCLHYEK